MLRQVRSLSQATLEDMVLRKGAAVRVIKGGRCCRALCSKAEVGVFWDLNKCGLEAAEMEDEGDDGEADAAVVHASHIAPNIVQALRVSGFSGPISIRAYGNTRSFSNHRITQALLATGVDLQHISGGMKYLCKHLILDMLLWVRENSPPAHLLLISGEKEFSSVLHKLRMRGYNVLLAHPEGDISNNLLNAASKVWVWDKILKGAELSALSPKYDCATHSDRPPKHSKSQCFHNQEVQPKLDAKSDFVCNDLKRKQQNIPTEVIDQVLNIIRSRPTGFTVQAFRRHLARSNVILDKDLYGHSDLLSFLLSVPKLKTKLIWTSDKTRTFLFTEDLHGKTSLNNDRNVELLTSPDHRDDGKDELFEADKAKGHSGNKLDKISCSQKPGDLSPKREPCKESSKEGDQSSHTRAEKSPGLFSGGANALSATWNKAASKLTALTKFWQKLGHEAAKTHSTISKDEESKSNCKNSNSEIYASYPSSPNQKEENENQVFHRKRVRNTIEGDTHKVTHDGTDHGELEDEQENDRGFPKRSNVLASSNWDGKQLIKFGRKAEAEALGRQDMLQNETSLLHESKISAQAANLTDLICEDVLSYLVNERSAMLTRSSTTLLLETAGRGDSSRHWILCLRLYIASSICDTRGRFM